MKVKPILLLFHVLVCTATTYVLADDHYELQRKLNEQVLSEPLHIPDDSVLEQTLDHATEGAKPFKSKKKDSYYRYYYNGYYYPHPYWYYGYPGYWK
jgi:hypothetical protein